MPNSNAVVGDRVVSVNSFTSHEICALEFGTLNEAYEFYYRYKVFSLGKVMLCEEGPKVVK